MEDGMKLELGAKSLLDELKSEKFLVKSTRFKASFKISTSAE